MPTRSSPILSFCTVALLLSSCGREGGSDRVKAETDPALTSAIADPIMVDTDLSSQNRASAAIAGGGAPVVELPLVERGPEAIASAKAEAAKLAGGKIAAAPSPREGGVPAGAQAVAAAQLASAAKGIAANCAGKADYALGWSQRLPEPLAIYPRGHLQEAAGADSEGCSLRVVSFVTPVEPGEVIDYYYTRVKAAGFNTDHRLAEGTHYLSGGKGGANYAVHARKLESGLTEVDLVASGG
jgi:hypothetical protein